MARLGLQALGAAAAMMMASWAAAANAPQLAALAKLETGEWELRLRDDPTAPARRLCVTMPHQLLEPANAGPGCKPFVVNDAPAAATVTFDCGPAGNARTDLRVETPRLIQIRSQGIRDGAPFSNMVEGRHVGACH